MHKSRSIGKVVLTTPVSPEEENTNSSAFHYAWTLSIG